MQHLTIRRAERADVEVLAALYDEVNDYLAANVNYPGWKKGVYPTREDAQQGIAEGCLYIAELGEKTAGSLILRHRQEKAYAGAAWSETLCDEQVLVLYTFVVSPSVRRLGVGAAMLAFAAEAGKRDGAKALRLDVYEKNTPAMRLYEKCGFRAVGTVSLGLEQFGLDRFVLYEKKL